MKFDTRSQGGHALANFRFRPEAVLDRLALSTTDFSLEHREKRLSTLRDYTATQLANRIHAA